MNNYPTVRTVYDRRHNGMIEICVTQDRERTYISTGIKVSPGEYRDGRVIKRRDTLECNERISVIRRKIERHISQCIETNQPITLSKIRAISAQEVSFLDYCRQRAAARNLSAGSRRNYQKVINALERYGKLQNFGDVSAAAVVALDEWLHDGSREQSSVYTYHKILKAILNDAVLEKKIENNPYNELRGRFPKGDKKVIEYLTDEELGRLMAYSSSIPARQRAADLFIFQCFTGLSYADMATFDLSEYDKIGDKYIANKTRVKSGERYVLQLLPPVVKIIEKYNGKLPITSNQRYNDQLKFVGADLGIRKRMHSHLARHTFATYMLSHGASVQNVMRMLGHTNLRQTLRYAEILAQDVLNDFDKIAVNLQ